MSLSRAGKPYTVQQPGREAVVKGFLDVVDGTYGETLQVPKEATLSLRIGAETVSTFQTP